MVQFYIPNLNTLVLLSQDWTFKLYMERRNIGLFEGLLKDKEIEQKLSRWSWESNWEKDVQKAGIQVYSPDDLELNENSYKSFHQQRQLCYTNCTIPSGTMLAVDRIYIRRGSEAWNSLTFRINKKCCPANKNYEKVRFWAKLQDVNNIVGDIVL